MLTRNLYEIDEVVAALQLCLWKRWPQAMFWAWELFVSEEMDTLKKTLKDLIDGKELFYFLFREAIFFLF